MSNLTVSKGSLSTEAQRWNSLPEDELHRRASAACRDRDTDTLVDLMLAFLVMRGKAGAHVSSETTRAYALSVRTLVADWSDVSLLSPDRNAGFRWVRSLEERGLAASSVTQRLAGARMLYAALRWALSTYDKPCTVDPFKDVKPGRDLTPAHEKRQPYPDEDVARLLAASTNPQDTALILLCGHAGLRVSEALAVRWEDLDLDARRVTVQHGKGGKRRSAPLSQSAVEHLSAMQRPGEYVIASYRSTEQARRHIEALCKCTGVRWRGIHALRHTVGTRVYRETGRLEDAQAMLGHQSVQTTMIYAKWADTRLKNSVRNW